MGYSVKILKDSIAPCGIRLTTWELRYPRFVHAELMTHRLFSRNSASSRAIPNEKLRKYVQDDPAMPVWWGKNQAGMQAREELVDIGHPPEGVIPYIEAFPLTAAKEKWLQARDLMLKLSEELAEIGLHKQLCNRLIEPWMYITVIVSATSFDNWFHLRKHKDAQPEIQKVAEMMWPLYQDNQPDRIPAGFWHLPLIEFQDVHAAAELCGFKDWQPRDIETVAATQVLPILKKVSVGRCARVSYLTHDGKRDLQEDIKLHDRLISGMEIDEPLHMSPFEHVAQALRLPEQSGNFRGWKQYRKDFPKEHFGGPMP